MRLLPFSLLLVSSLAFFLHAAEPVNVAGVYPHLTMYNNEGECGTGAVVPWADRLWVITYAPHRPMGSSGKLYEITPELQQIIRPESIGGTPANRMIHKESQQLVIGPYLIDAKRAVRAIPYTQMPGRHTGNARHLTEPANKVYFATMEEGLYSVEVNTLAVTEHIKNGFIGRGKAVGNGIESQLPGYHGKGLYSGQGFLVYANNGDRGPKVKVDPTVDSGALAVWQGSGDWQLVRRNQFTEVTGPGGIYGNSKDDAPVWSMGWDAKSLILMLLEDKQWHAYRLPKGSHSYDGAHGWNTEWPRIREIGQDTLLATMHGTFWHFPKTFSTANSAGIAPRSNYLKVVGDFAKWHNKVVLGCDDSAQKEFLNHRPYKSKHGAPLQSNSNLWFVEPETLDNLGPAIGRGSVWLRDDLQPGATSDPYLFSGYDHRLMVIHHQSDTPVTLTVEVDKAGNGNWTQLRDLTVDRSHFHLFDPTETGTWIRLRTKTAAKQLTVHFHYRNNDQRPATNAAIFAPIAIIGARDSVEPSRIRSTHQTLSVLAGDTLYSVDDKLAVTPSTDAGKLKAVKAADDQPLAGITVDAASAIIKEDGKTYRIPKNDAYLATKPGTPNQTAPNWATIAANNLARGATVRASGTHADYAPANAVDGKLGDDSRWLAKDAEAKWLELELPTPATFRAIAVVSGLRNATASPIQNATISTKVNGNWQPLPGATTSKAGHYWVINFDQPQTSKALRLESTDAGYVRVYEISLLADAITEPAPAPVAPRICREVATERDLFNFHGTFYELPARNAQGFAKIRPVATHNLAIADYASHFGLLFLTGLNKATNDRVISSPDGKIALWTGVIDDLWQLGKPRGRGGPWQDTPVEADAPSDPYLMTGFDKKTLTLSTTNAATITVEIDVDGTGLWVPYKSFQLTPGTAITHSFPEGFSAYWVRTTSNTPTAATAQLTYE